MTQGNSKLENTVIVLIAITVICALFVIANPVAFRYYGYAAIGSSVIALSIFIYIAISGARKK